jgi:hypothetical protein
MGGGIRPGGIAAGRSLVPGRPATGANGRYCPSRDNKRRFGDPPVALAGRQPDSVCLERPNEDNFDIYVKAAAEGEAIRLTDDPANDFAPLLSCGLRRHELAELTFGHLQQREGHWAIVDLNGKAGHVRTIPVPDWVYGLVDEWTKSAGIESGRLFRRVSSAGRA